MKSKRKPYFWALFFSVLLAVFSLIYLHYGIFPGDAKTYVIEKIEAATRKKVTFDKAVFLPIRGFVFYNVKVSEPRGRSIFTAKQFGVNARILPFIREKKIVIANIYLDSPYYEAILQPKNTQKSPKPIKTELSGQIDVPVAGDKKQIRLEDIEENPETFLPENVYLEQIQVNNGFLLIRQTEESPALEQLNAINLRMAFQRPPVLEIDGSFEMGEENDASMNFRGSWNLQKADYHFDVTTRLDRVPAWLLAYQEKHFLVLRQGRLLIQSKLQSVGEDKALFYSKVDLKKAAISIRQATYAGEMRLEAKGLFNFRSRVFERYKGSLDFSDIRIDNLTTKIPLLVGIDGKMDFEPDLLAVRSLSGTYKEVPFEARGSIRSFKELNLDGEIYMRLGINKLLSLIPAEQKAFLKNFDISGDCSSKTRVRGSLHKPSELATDHNLVARGITLESQDKKFSLTEGSSEIALDSSGIRLLGTKFIHQKKPYRLEAFIPKDSSKPGKIKLISQEFRVSTDYVLSQNKVQLKNAFLDYHDFSARFKGWVSDFKRPVLDVEGDLTGDLLSLFKNPELKAPWLKTLGLRGTVSGPFSLKGLWNNPRQWTLAADLKSESVRITDHLRLDKLDAQIRLKNQLLDIPYFHAELYRGMVGGKIIFDLSQPGNPFNGRVYANNIDLRQMAQELKLSNKDLAGNLVLQLTLHGYSASQETYQGQGSVSVSKGYLFKTDRFKQMGNLPFVRVEGLEEVVFRDLSATFEVRDKKLWTDNLTLLGDTVNLALDGSIGFNQALDMEMGIEYSGSVFRGAEDAGGLAPLMVNQVSDMISKYRVTGSLKDPKYDKMLLPSGKSAGKKITGIFQQLVQ